MCLRCILRLLKISQIDLYRDKEFFLTTLNIISEKLNLERNLLCDYDFENLIIKTNDRKVNICCVCLGILQLQDKEDNLKELIEKVKKEDFEFSSFKLTLKIPLTTTIRAYQVNSFLYCFYTSIRCFAMLVNAFWMILISILKKKMFL